MQSLVAQLPGDVSMTLQSVGEPVAASLECWATAISCHRDGRGVRTAAGSQGLQNPA